MARTKSTDPDTIEITWTGDNFDDIKEKFPTAEKRITGFELEIIYANQVNVVAYNDKIVYDGESIKIVKPTDEV